MADTKQYNHVLVPVHEKLAEKEKQELLEKYNITMKQLPRISKKDPAIAHLDVASGDIIRISRSSSTAGKSQFYRVVIDV